ncbi:heparinase II/III family protein [Aestuariispira insulae]|uniref:Putative heparinase superfamily protein n=1 Tax=Aestuariispira insulae TaxID=1461337 RepID=A0A3D9HIE8_9PROT|nr:heparinase II/III family protein [Aestuariispira insulae]RED49205.1 putative heparinase superfamily protein [Aestuariispira insulae]
MQASEGTLNTGKFWPVLRYALFRLTGGRALYGLTLLGGTFPFRKHRIDSPWAGEPARGEAIATGRYHFAGQTIAQERNPWEAAGASPDWLCAMNDFRWIRDLQAYGSEIAILKARALTSDWITRNNNLASIRLYPSAWKPAVIANRISTWLRHWPFFIENADPLFQQQVTQSLRRQVRHLTRVSPFGPQNIDRFTVAKGLVIAQLSMPNLSVRLDKVMDQLQEDLSKQFLADGGPATRNPEDLVAVFREFVEMQAAFQDAGMDVPGVILNALDRCAATIRFFRHGDGGLGIFNGGREGHPAEIEALLRRSGSKATAPQRLPHCGFERLQAGKTIALIDAGAPPPAPYDKHAHAETAALEISIGKDRLLVNCGLDSSPRWQEVRRTTAAHSTLTLDETNSSALRDKGGFTRRRAACEITRHDGDGPSWVTVAHNGYVPSFGLQHTRRVYLSEDGTDLRGEDKLEGSSTKERAAFKIRFHLHPKCSVSLVNNQSSALVRLPGGSGYKFRCKGAEMSLEDSVYMGDGELRRSQQIVLTGLAGEEATIIKWAFHQE